jgi:glutathione S-transferase
VLRLVVIPISHYCEKARWALQRAGLAFREERHLQILHRRAVRAAGGGHLTPVLVTPKGPISESSQIVEYASRHLPVESSLYPEPHAAAIRDFERELDAVFGVESRKLFYEVGQRCGKAFLMEVNNQGAPLIERAMLRTSYPFAMRFLNRYLEIDAESVAAAERHVRETLDDVASRLDDGRPFLFAERFTAADLAFAALSSPLSYPAEYGLPIPPRSSVPPALDSFLRRFDDHAAIHYARKVYREERARVVAPLAA